MRNPIFFCNENDGSSDGAGHGGGRKCEAAGRRAAGNGADRPAKIHNGVADHLHRRQAVQRPVIQSPCRRSCSKSNFSSDAGISVFSFTCSCDRRRRAFPGNDPVWVAPGNYDYRSFDDKTGNVLSAKPGRIFLSPPGPVRAGRWMKAHPDDIVLERTQRRSRAVAPAQ